MKKIIIAIVISMMMMFLTMGCSSNKAKGGAIGAATGGVVGSVIGDQAGNTVVGALIGAAVGGAAGVYIGHYMDEQAEEIREDLEDAEVERVGEGIKITFDSGLLFDVDESTLRETSKSNLTELAETLNKYHNTNILIEGHTDATGPEEYNMELSRERAQAVSSYLATLNVNPTRFTVVGYGEKQPVATNETASGRQQNRRVDLAIMANEKLKKIAKEETSS